MRPRLSGETRSSAGPVRVYTRRSRSHVSYLQDDPNDAFWLAQTYFLTHQYSRAERLLTRPFPTNPPKPPRAAGVPNGVFDAQPSVRDPKGKGKEMLPSALLPTSKTPAEPRLPVGGPGEMINVAAEHADGVSRLVDMSVACRYLAAQSQVRQGKWTEATEMLGEANPFRGSGRSGPAIPNTDGGIKVRAALLAIYCTLLKCSRSKRPCVICVAYSC